MDSATLAQAMGHVVPQAVYDQFVSHFNAALIAAECTTVNRAAMFCAQVGHESLGLRYMEEIASGAAYEGRTDLGNMIAGDGKRFKGRGPIQLTGRNNYAKFSQWCNRRGHTSSAGYFVQNPTEVAKPQWGFLAAAWYWTVARPQLNAYSDASDIVAATKAVNGGANGLSDRTQRWNAARALGDRLLPNGAQSAPGTATIAPIREGDTGPAVLKLQTFLNQTFPAYSRIDLGPQRYGPQTVAVVKEFQKRSGIAEGDGKNVGPQTLAALQKLGYRS